MTPLLLRALAPLLALLALGACESPTGLEVDLSLYASIPQVAELEFAQVRPAGSWPYWELRFSWGLHGPEDQVLGAGGTLSRSELDPAVLEALEAASVPSGFAGGCLPAWCFKYVAAVDAGGGIRILATREELRTFLAPVESLEEAVLLLDAESYTWHGPDFGIRRQGSGWEAVVLELVRACAPVQTDRVLVRVSWDGEVRVVGREVWERLENACI